jgi:phosphoenolpyruvate synthase/pyruvate phosphate dikinase
MKPLVLSLEELNRESLAMAGGKVASLGELMKVDGVEVPKGFCLTAEAFRQVIDGLPEIAQLLNQLAVLKATDRKEIAAISARIRGLIEGATIPEDIVRAVASRLSGFDAAQAFAVRSSATAEDLPTASFAGQQDSFMNVKGEKEIIRHISKCWASLFTERAVTYRIQNQFDHGSVKLAVVVQQMVFPQVAGILFTADPQNGNRKVVSIDASFGLGEALVSGIVNTDNYKVRDSKTISKTIATKRLAVYASADGGTAQQQLDSDQENQPSLTDEHILTLEHAGRKIEAHFGNPQDIEWCLADDKIYIVQSRPITTLYPIPQTDDGDNHVYLSVGHQQMMTDAMKPLGLSVRQLTSGRPFYTAGGRQFVDVARDLASPAKRRLLIDVLGKLDLLNRDAMTTIVERGDFIKTEPEAAEEQTPAGIAPVNHGAMLENDPAIVAGLIGKSEASIEALKVAIGDKSGQELFDIILADMGVIRNSLQDPQNFGAIMTGMNASAWLNDKMQEWLGEKNAADMLSKSAPHNITSQMGLELMDVADVARPYPEVISYLQQEKVDDFPDGLLTLEGGAEVWASARAFLDKYGMRCAGEIDIARTRWSEQPGILIPMILNNIKNFEPHASAMKFEMGRQEALSKEDELLERLKCLPDGEARALETKEKIGLLRTFTGYREYPKYDIVSRYQVYKQALMREADRLVTAGIIQDREDIYYLSFEELQETVRSKHIDDATISKRKEEFKRYEKLTPPRVMTSDGEVISGAYRREDLPKGAIAGQAVSSGVVEGRARVILNIEDADLEPGDILITTFTDPSWTPLFVGIKGLVTEVGGLMTHGSVIAREYGLPAVVGVDHATTLIKDGQRIRVDGTDGYVELL